MNITFNGAQLQNICDIIATKLTKSELEKHLRNCRISLLDNGQRTSNNGEAYITGLSKAKWLYNCLTTEINKNGRFDCVYQFIESALNPTNYTREETRDKYNTLLEETNKFLLLLGLIVNKSGKIVSVPKANDLQEVDRRVDSLKKKLYDRAIHDEVKKYCINDYLRKDYYDAIFEATKGLGERVREITGLKEDGADLFNKAFSSKDPYIIMNKLETPSEFNEYNGVKELLLSLYHIVRNPAAHTPKINWETDETKALDILTVISFAHKYLDVCYKHPAK